MEEPIFLLRLKKKTPPKNRPFPTRNLYRIQDLILYTATTHHEDTASVCGGKNTADFAFFLHNFTCHRYKPFRWFAKWNIWLNFPVCKVYISLVNESSTERVATMSTGQLGNYASWHLPTRAMNHQPVLGNRKNGRCSCLISLSLQRLFPWFLAVINL